MLGGAEFPKGTEYSSEGFLVHFRRANKKISLIFFTVVLLKLHIYSMNFITLSGL